MKPTGLPFNSRITLEIYDARSVNPLVNAGAIAAFSPRLNEAGNSVRALNAIRDIAGELGVGVFGANPK